MKCFEIVFERGQIVRGRTTADWCGAPKTGVQAIVVCNDNGSQEKIHGFDFYSLINGNEIIGADGSLRQGFVKEGSLISDEDFMVIETSLEDVSEIWNATSG